MKVKTLLRKFWDAIVSAYVENRKWHFRLGIFFTPVGMVFLLRFGIGYATWIPLGIGLGNLAIWFLVRLSFKQQNKLPEAKNNSEHVDT